MWLLIGLVMVLWSGYLVVSNHPREVPLGFCALLIVFGSMAIGWGLGSLITS